MDGCHYARARCSHWIARESCETWKCGVISLSGSYVSRVHADGRYKRNPSHDEIEIEFDNVGCGFDWLISISSSFLFFLLVSRHVRIVDYSFILNILIRQRLMLVGCMEYKSQRITKKHGEVSYSCQRIDRRIKAYF